MAASINNGWVNFRVSNFMAQHTNQISKNVTRLAGNTKFASGADDPAAFAYGQKLRSSAMISSQAIENLQNAQTKAKIADSAYGSMLDILSKAKDLAAQKAAVGDDNAIGIDEAIGSLSKQIGAISKGATFNGESVLSEAIKYTIDTDAEGAAVEVENDALGEFEDDIGATVADIQTQIETVLKQQATAGAMESGLGYVSDFLTSKAAYMQEAATNASAVNITTEMSDYVSNQIALQSAQFIAAQQNQNAYSVLNLLK